jgi:hypothetical protein
MAKKAHTKKKAKRGKPLLERITPLVTICVSVVTVCITAATLVLMKRRDAEQIKVDAARHIVQTVDDLLDESPQVVWPVAEGLKQLGDSITADALTTSVEEKRRSRPQLSPVLLPDHRDSADATLARAEGKVREQGRLPSGFVVGTRVAEPPSSPEIEVVRIPRDSSRVTLPSGEVVQRADLGGLWEDGYGRLTCGGECLDAQACCRIRVTQ